MNHFKKGKILNKLIIFGYHNSRYIRINSNKHITNRIIKTKISELGESNYLSNLNLKGSSQHKGIKKIIFYCKENNNINITGHEIKSLFKTRKKNKKSEDIIFCTYNVYLILKVLTEILKENIFIKYYEFLPEYYSKINAHIQEMERMEIQLQRPYIKKNKIQKVIIDLSKEI